MQIQKTKLAIAIGSLGLFMGTAQVANAGTVELNMPGSLVPTFSTDISGPGSANQAFYAADVYWTPAVNVGANSSVRFNLGGQDGNPAKFATNAIDVNNFVLDAGNAVVSAVTAAWTGTGTDAQRAAVLASFDAVTTSTPAQIAAAINAGVVAGTDGGIVGGDLAAIDAAIAAQLTVADAGVAATAAAAIVAQFAGLVGTVAGPQVTLTGVPAGSYTNGDSVSWYNLDGTAYGRIFTTTTAGGIGQFDVTVSVKPALTGDANGQTGGITGDTIRLSLNSGKFANNDSTPRTFASNPNPDTRVDVTNLLAQGFDGTSVAGYADSGKIKIFVSVQQGGTTVDQTGNSTLYAASAQPLVFTGYKGNSGVLNADVNYPTTINLAADEKKFSANHGLATWFSNDLDTTAASDLFNHLGSFKFEVGVASGISYVTRGQTAPLAQTQVSDPNGNPYALTADDKIQVAIRSYDDASQNTIKADGFTPLSSIFLRAGNDCTAVVNSADFALSVNSSEIPAAGSEPAVAKGSRAFAEAALIAGTTYVVCARTGGTNELTTLTAKVNAKLLNIEPTYQDPVLTPATLGTWGRNGCDATFFNVPGNGPTASGVDKGFLRFTNTTGDADNAGSVRVKVYGQDGALKGTPGRIMATAGAAGLTGTLKGHQTGVYNAHDVARAVGLGSLATDTSVNVFPNERVRVVMSGGFATCEGQNMIATGNGISTNATATTNANTNSDDARPGFNGNNSN